MQNTIIAPVIPTIRESAAKVIEALGQESQQANYQSIEKTSAYNAHPVTS
jgi:hypothetical protein